MIVENFKISLVKVYDSPGRGRKQCKGCNKYVGIRNQSCVCGMEFVASESKPSNEEEYSKAVKMFAFRMGFTRGRICYTPSGPIYTKLASLSQNDVNRFCDDVIEEYIHKDALLHPDAIKYIGRRFLELSGDDLELFKIGVDEWFSQISCEYLECND